MFTPFALAGKHSPLQIANLGPRQLQFTLQCGIGLGTRGLEFTQNSLVAPRRQ